MQRLEIHKFGGTSVAGLERMLAVTALVEQAAGGSSLVIIASAMAGVTDSLVKAAGHAAKGELTPALHIVDGLLARHEAVLEEMIHSEEREANAVPTGEAEAVRSDLHRLTSGVADVLRAAVALGELTPRANDRILATGEKLSVRLLSLIMRRRGLPAVAMDADAFLETDGNFGEASALDVVSDHAIQAALRPRLERGDIPIVTGYCGRAPDGATTTLGRGGSDLSATIMAAALRADEVTIWTDVDGVFSADPRVVPGARLIRQLNYREATEMSYYGAKVLHQRTILPVARHGIPVRIRNSIRPGPLESVVDRRFTPGSHPVKAISAIHGQTLISVEGKGMAGVPGVARRVFGALAREGISVTMISQSSSEASICLALPARDAVRAEMALKQEFRVDLSHGSIEEIVVRAHVGLVAAVGLGMAHTPGVAARVFSALGRRRISVLAIAQGSSELNISLAVDQSEVNDAVRAIHDEFGLHRLDTGVDTAEGFDLMLLGCGQIGRTLVELVLRRQAHMFERFGLKARIVAISDRSGFLFHPSGLSQEQLAIALDAKAGGRPLADLPGAQPARNPAAMVAHALEWRLARPVLVDVSDFDESLHVFREALRLGCDVVTANKKPLAGRLESFRALQADAAATGRRLKAEATVGAGLPVVDTLEMLLATGDRLTRVQGCLSGTLGYLMARLEEGIPFSTAVAEAAEKGYTEPDPVADLSGADVARKAVIIGRLSGLTLDDAPVHLAGLVDDSLAGLERARLFEQLRAYDAPISAQLADAKARGKVLRYVATVEPTGIRVGLTEVAPDSALGGLKGTDNLIVFESERYRTRPLVVIGPGAGAEVTAMGVLGDILRIAAERR